MRIVIIRDMKVPPPTASGVARDRPASSSTQRRVVRAADLFGDSRELVIEHASGTYRLRITQNDKLILTK